MIRDPATLRPSLGLALALALPLLLAVAPPAAAQQDTTVAAGPRYEAGELREALLGEEYRTVWATPARVPVLDLDTFAGGLTPVRRGGGNQTTSLRFKAENGWEYNFRSVDKEITKGLPDWLQETLVDRVLQDQTSALHPAAAGVASALLDSAEVLNPGPRLIVLPDDPRLGEFRTEFAGRLGWIEAHADEDRDRPERGFAGAVRVAGSDRVLEHLEEDPAHRIDARAYLRARLMDLLLADWDRHAGQFRWARVDEGGIHRWVPIPEDRDYAFVSYDGLLPRVARRTFVPRANPYRDRIRRDLLPLVISAEAMDRRFLAGLPREAWDSAALRLQRRLTDSAIESAVRTMPEPWHERSGEELARRLRGRRDGLPQAARRFHDLVMQAPEVHATDRDELAEVIRHRDGSVTVRLAVLGDGEPGEPYFERTFPPRPTREVRLFLRGGDDRLVVRGRGAGRIRLHVVGGGGDDVLADSSRTAGGAARVVLYDSRGENRFVRSAGTVVDTATFEPPARERDVLSLPSRDWGVDFSRFSPWIDYRAREGGVVLGGGPSYTRYGFRSWPYALRLRARVMYAPGSGRAGALAEADFRRRGGRGHLLLRGSASELETQRFHGFGNATPPARARMPVLFSRTEILAEAIDHRRVGESVWLSLGPVLRWTDADLPVRAEGLPPYGSGSFGAAGARSELDVDTRDVPSFPTRGIHLRMGGAAFAPVEDAGEPFGSAWAAVATYARLPAPLPAVVAVRAGAERALGRFPVHEAAFLGGSGSLRGYAHQRFAGDAALYAGSELRVPLFEANLVVRGTLGVSGLADAGRVYFRGRSEGGWHAATGGSLWFATPRAVVSLTYARGETDRVYLRLGMPF